jgi:hypothetical protein
MAMIKKYRRGSSMKNKKIILLHLVVIFALGGYCGLAQEAKYTKKIVVQLLPSQHDSSLARLTESRPREHRLEVISQKQVLGAPQVQRNPQLSEDDLVVSALDSEGTEITRIYIPDPRLLRSEDVDSRGNFTSKKRLYRRSAKLIIPLPDNSGIKSIQIFQPHWTGTEFTLELLGEMQLF